MLPLALGLALALVPNSVASSSFAPAPVDLGVPDLPEADELFAAWKALPDSDRADTIEWYVAECDNARHFRAELERFVLNRHAGKRYDWPTASPEPPLYDTKKHTPAQHIPRRFVNEKASKYRRTREKLVGDRNTRSFRAAFRYDWARGTVVKLASWDDPERIAFNAARGMSPYGDLVEALVEMELDGGEVRAEAEAFGHAYSDRSGHAYRSITLYDAWSSGTEIEMPDVECLGILHDLEGDWKTYVAPVATRLQRPLYDRIGVHFAKLKKYRSMRTAIARCYLAAKPSLPNGYGPSVLRLHGFWELQSSDPVKMAADLPTSKGWGAWFDERAAQADDDPDVVARARARMESLQESTEWSRRTFHGILKEYGAFDPKPPEGATGGDGDGGGGR